jgi:hypothetical protein
MARTQTREIQTLEPIISGRNVRFGGIEGFLKDENGVAASSERVLGLVGTPEGYDENKGNRIFYNLEGKKLQLTKYMTINDNNDNELVKIEGKNEKEIVEKWRELRRNKCVYVSDFAIEKAAEGGALFIYVDYVRDDVWNGRLLLDGVDSPDVFGRVAYDKQAQADGLELRKGDLLEIERGEQKTLIKFDGDAVVKVKRR